MGQAPLFQWGYPAPTVSPPYLQASNAGCHTTHSDGIGSDVTQKLLEATLGEGKRASIVSSCPPSPTPFQHSEAIKTAPNFHASPHLYRFVLGPLLGAGFRAIDIFKATEWGKDLVVCEVGRLLKIRVVVEATALELETRRGGCHWGLASLSPLQSLPSPPYPFHGAVPHLCEVFLGAVVLLDGLHCQQCQVVLSLGRAGQCLGPDRQGSHSQATTHFQGFAQSYSLAPSPILTTEVYTKATTAAATSAMKMMRRMKKN